MPIVRRFCEPHVGAISIVATGTGLNGGFDGQITRRKLEEPFGPKTARILLCRFFHSMSVADSMSPFSLTPSVMPQIYTRPRPCGPGMLPRNRHTEAKNGTS